MWYLLFESCLINCKKCINYNINLELCYYFIEVLRVFVKQYLVYVFHESGLSSKHTFRIKLLCEIVNFSNKFKILQFQFER